MDDNARALRHERTATISDDIEKAMHMTQYLYDVGKLSRYEWDNLLSALNGAYWLRAEVARLQTDMDSARAALDQAVGSALAERATRISGEAVILAARRVMIQPSRDNLTALVAKIADYDKALEGRA